MRDRIFGTGRTSADLGGTFAPRSAGHEPGAVLATYRGPGRERVLGVFERFNLISAEQRAAGGSVEGAGSGARYAVGSSRGFRADAPQAYAGGVIAGSGTPHANPVYDGLFARTLMREQGFVPPAGVPDDFADAADDVVEHVAPQSEPNAAIAAATDDAIAAGEQRLVAAFGRLNELPKESHVTALGMAVDRSSAAGHGDDAFGVLAGALADRPLESSAQAMEQSIDELVRSTPKAGPATASVERAVTGTAPVVDEVADVVARAVPQVVEAAVPKVVAAAAKQSILLPASHDALRGAMSFSAGVDDTLRLLARL